MHSHDAHVAKWAELEGIVALVWELSVSWSGPSALLPAVQ